MCGFPVQARRAAVAAIVAGLLGMPSTALGVVGGTPVPAADYPWFATFDGCGGALVLPDRVLTAAACVEQRLPGDLGEVRIGPAESRRATRVAQYPNGWDYNGVRNLDNVALIRLDRPVETVRGPRLGGPLPPSAVLLGWDESEDAGLVAAPMRTIADGACRRAYRDYEASIVPFYPRRMLCAVDPDGVPPLASACNDEGAPLLSGSPYGPVLHGVVSDASYACGQDGMPTVFADMRRYRTFAYTGRPEWAPVPRTPARIRGRPRVGRRLTCGVRSWAVRPSRIWISWGNGGDPAQEIGAGRSYRVRRRDRGKSIGCSMLAETAGGRINVPEPPTVYIP